MIDEKFIKIIDLVLLSGESLILPRDLSKMGKKTLEKKMRSDRKARFKRWKKAQLIIYKIQFEIFEKAKENFGSNAWYMYRCTQRLLDTILWLNFGNDHTDMKRVVSLDKPIKKLLDHNIKTHLGFACQINESDDQFALITDLSSGTRLGDLFVVNIDKPSHFIEVKSGQVNSEISHALFKGDGEEIHEIVKCPKKRKQAERMLKQGERATNIMSILRNGYGEDDQFKDIKNVTVTTVDKPLDTFEHELDDLIQSLGDKSCESKIIEDCLLAIVVDNSISEESKTKVNKLVLDFEVDNDKGGILLDWNFSLAHCQFYKPIFLQHLSDASKLDIVLMKKSVYLYFSFQKFANKFSKKNFKIDVLTDKKFKKISGKFRGSSFDILANKKSCVVFKNNEGRIEPFSYGLFDRVPSLLIKPSYLLYLQKYTSENTK